MNVKQLALDALYTAQSFVSANGKAGKEIAEAIAAIKADLAAKVDDPADCFEPAAWLVFDEDGVPIMCSPAMSMCHEHINDALNDFDILEASKWVVRPLYAAPKQVVPAWASAA